MIKKALQIIGVLPEGQLPNATQIEDASITLGMLNKSYAAEGLVSWGLTSYILFTAGEQGKYRLRSDYNERWTTQSAYNYARLGLNVGATFSIITLEESPNNPFSDDTSFSPGDKAILQMDNGEYFISNIDSKLTSKSFIIHDGLSTGASAGNLVYITDVIAPKPGRISYASVSQGVDNDTMLNFLSFKDYMELANKTQRGIPTSYSYNLTKDACELYLWPIPDKGYRITLLAEAPYSDLDTEDDYPIISNEVYLAFVYELAALLAVEYGVDLRMLQEINRRARDYKETALGFADQNAYVIFEPDYRMSGGF